MASFVRHTECPKCGSKDNLAVYSDGSSHCFGCEYTVPSEAYKEATAGKKGTKERTVMTVTEEKKASKPALTQEQIDEIKEETGTDAQNYRGIRNEIYKYFGVRHSYYEKDGSLAEQYYPVTQDSQLVGYKIRELPKQFRSKGRTGQECELFMQFRFNKPGRYCIITEGELDALSAYQMMKDYNKSKGWEDFETAVVSPTTGANSAKQVAGQFKFFDQFEKVVICYDNDKAGKEAVEELVKVLPKGKTYVMNLRMKDANEYLKSDNESAFIKDFWAMTKFVPVGVVGSSQIMDQIMQQVTVPKVAFPPFMPKLNEMLGGGIPLGHIVNIASSTGAGKTTLVNEFVYYWLFNSPHLTGIVSMELDTAQYGEVLLSRHLSRKLAAISDVDAKLNLLNSDDIQTRATELFQTSAGLDRFFLLDNRDGSVEEIQSTIEELVVSCGCKIIVLDPLQDILAGLSVDEQEVFMQWCKGFVKSHKVTFILINHIRKSASGGAQAAKGDAFTEEEIQGSSTIIKSASINILMSRNKYAEDPIERNTTKIVLSKNRVLGITGPAGEIYYDNDTHTLSDKESYFAAHPELTEF